jgi:hypothetical protein
VLWDFYRHAMSQASQPDRLRQRLAFALQQMLVVSGLEPHKKMQTSAATPERHRAAGAHRR